MKFLCCTFFFFSRVRFCGCVARFFQKKKKKRIADRPGNGENMERLGNGEESNNKIVISVKTFYTRFDISLSQVQCRGRKLFIEEPSHWPLTMVYYLYKSKRIRLPAKISLSDAEQLNIFNIDKQ